MSHQPRPSGGRRWWALGLTGVLLVALGVTVSAVSAAPRSSTPDDDADPRVPIVSTPGSWSDDLGIPAGASDEQRLQVKLSYDLVAVPLDEFAGLLATPGVEVVHPETRGRTVYAAVPSTDVAAVRAGVPAAIVTPNAVVQATADESPVPSWGLDVVDNSAAASDGAYLYDSTGQGVTAYVVDTGVQSTHPDFGGRVDAAAGHDEVGDGKGTEDCNGHGTHVAGTIGSTTYGVAKDVRIVPVRVLGCDGKGSVLDILYGLLWIYDNESADQAVINMSLGAQKIDIFNQIADEGVDAGFVMAVAAGNDTQDACNASPASASEVITVGAFDNTRALAWYSNFGSCVDILAPGSGITSTWIGSSTNTISGTSMASPHVAGLAARLLQLHPTWHTADVQSALTTSAAQGHISGLPAGTINLVAAIPGVPKIASLQATRSSSGIALAWTTNDIGTFQSFSVTVTDTTTHRSYPVTVTALRSATVFLDVQVGHAYTAQVTGAARMPSGAVLATDPATATVP